MELQFEFLNENNWSQFEALFGEKGACAGCWCMLYRLTNKEWQSGKKNGENKIKMQHLVFENKMTGVLAFHKNEAIAWAAFSPREDFQKLDRSRIHKKIDDTQVWSIPCVFIKKEFRKMGISTLLLKGIIDLAKKNNIRHIEAYPIKSHVQIADAFAWNGVVSSFEKAGFTIVSERSNNHPMMRIKIE